MVGVDKLMYMKSISGDDGSYTLTLSFELGTDPDINTVNANNRVQVALSKLPSEVKQQGVTVKKQSSALLGVISILFAEQDIRRTVHFELRDDQSARRHQGKPGVGDAKQLGAQDYAMRVWMKTDRMTGLDLTASDVIQAIQAQNAQAAAGRIGARPISNDQQLQLNVQIKGRLDQP